MNFIDKFFLWLVLQPTLLYKKLGVDIEKLRAVLTAKLTMDNRRPVSFGNYNRGKEKKATSKATLGTMLGSLFMGLFLLFMFATGVDMLTKLSMFMSLFIFMLCITLITDFTSVLIDVRDNLIILPKPISDVTFVTARLLHITIRTAIVVLPLTLPAGILVATMQGVGIILPFILMVVLMTLLSIFFINAIYILILKITTPTKFQSVIGSIQIAFVMLIMVSYQLLPKVMQSETFRNASVTDLPFIQFYPPFWFADACMMLSGKGLTAESLLSLGLAFIVPILSIWTVVRFFAPSFNRKLGMITSGSSEQSVSTKKSNSSKKFALLETLAGWFTKPGAERAGFVFAGKMMGRSRDFKMKVYPSIGYLIVVFGMMFFQGHSFEVLTESTKLATPLLLVIYISSMLVSGALMQLPYSDKYRASWLFQVVPVQNPGLLISGAVKSILVTFFLPLALSIIAFGLVLQGPAILPNLILGCINVLVIESILALILVKNLPFSVAQEGAAKGNTFIRSMLFMIFPVGFGFLHYAMSGFPAVIYLLILVSAVVPWLVFDEIKKLKWQQMKS